MLLRCLKMIVFVVYWPSFTMKRSDISMVRYAKLEAAPEEMYYF